MSSADAIRPSQTGADSARASMPPVAPQRQALPVVNAGEQPDPRAISMQYSL